MAINSKTNMLSTQSSGGEEIVRITVRKGNEADFLPSEMLPGELAISIDKGIARYCYAPGMIKIFATREDIYEIIDSSPEDYEKFKELVEYFKQNENVYNEIIANIGTLKNDVSYLKQNVSELGERCDKIEESIGSGGPSGTTVSVNVGDTVTGEPGTQAAVVNTGNNTNVILEFTIPRGEDGKPGSDGITPNLKMGQVSTLGPDEQATASITGDAENPVLNLGIPQGKPGSGSGGVSNNYEDLDNKPRIAGVEVSGNKSLEDYGIQPKGNYLQSIPEEYVTETELNSKGFLTSEDIPDSLPNPHKLIFTGAVDDEYDGRTEKIIRIPQGGSGTQNGIPSGGTTGQVLTKRSNGDYDVEWRNAPSGGGGDVTDIDQIRDRTYLIEIPDTKELTIADNREEILQTVKDGKYKYLYIPDGIKHWNAPESKYDYPKKLTMEYIRNSEFYANMWLPNEMNCHKDLRYKVNTNGAIKYDDVNEKADLTAILQWGILMLGENKEYPTETIHFIISNFKTLGFNSQTRSWELIHDTYPTGGIFNIEGTTADEDTIDIPGINLNNGFYSFEISQDNWHNKEGNPMCFHFFPKVGIFPDSLRKYENLIVAFRISIQETKYDNTFVVMAGSDAYGSSVSEEMFYSRFRSVRAYSKLINVTSVLESESYKYVFSTDKLYELLDDGESSGGGSIIVPSDGSSFYANKTIVMFGDSIVAGWGWEEGTGITQPLKENYPDATWINKAESGANMAEKSGAGHPSILSVIKGYSGKADYILVNGGTNDGNNGITIGSLGSSYEGPFTETTYIGALESAFKTLNDKFPMSHKCFLIPHKFVYDDNYLKEITDAAIKTCEKWSVPLVRMDQNSQIVMTEANKTKYTRNPNTGKGDGVHPNEEWYRSLYSPYVDGFLRKLGGVLGKESTPPSDSHTVLDYINVDGRCYFDTGVVPNLQTNFEIKCNPTNFEISGSYVCGIHDGTYKYGLSGTDNWYVVRGTVSSASKPYVHYSQDWIIKQNGTNVLFNDDPVTLDSASDLSPSGTFFVCNMNNGSGSAKGENGLNGKLYYLKLYTGEELTCDLIPVKKSDGTICLYDNISKKYIYNIGTGTVSA